MSIKLYSLMEVKMKDKMDVFFIARATIHNKLPHPHGNLCFKVQTEMMDRAELHEIICHIFACYIKPLAYSVSHTLFFLNPLQFFVCLLIYSQTHSFHILPNLIVIDTNFYFLFFLILDLGLLSLLTSNLRVYFFCLEQFPVESFSFCL